MTEPIGDIGARDQVAASIGQLTYAVATYYRQLRAGGVPPTVALELVCQYQGFLLSAGLQAPGPH